MPHGIAVVVELFEKRENSDILDIQATIVCERKSHKPIILGKKGSMIKEIGIKSRHDIQGLLGSRVHLDLWVKVKDRWRDSDFLMRNYGYDNKEV